MTLNLGSFMEREKLCTDARRFTKRLPLGIRWSVKGKGTSDGPTRPKTNAVLSGRPTRSSVEASVMGVDRRGRIIQV